MAKKGTNTTEEKGLAATAEGAVAADVAGGGDGQDQASGASESSAPQAGNVPGGGPLGELATTVAEGGVVGNTEADFDARVAAAVAVHLAALGRAAQQPDSGPREYQVLCALVNHNGTDYLRGKPITLTSTEAQPLLDVAAISASVS